VLNLEDLLLTLILRSTGPENDLTLLLYLIWIIREKKTRFYNKNIIFMTYRPIENLRNVMLL
jgi:hypothetical protein